MWSPATENRQASGATRRVALLWAALIGLAFGFSEFGAPLEDMLRAVRNAIRPHAASGEIVVVSIDDQSIDKLGEGPWSRRRQAQIIDELRDLGARRIALDIDVSTVSSPSEDALLEAALARASGQVILPVRFVEDPASGKRTNVLPLQGFRENAALASVNMWSNYGNMVWRLPYALETAGTIYPSLAARLAGRMGGDGEMFPIDYSITLKTIPVLSAIDLLRGQVRREEIAGKSVVIGTAATQPGDVIFIPGIGEASRDYLHVLGAETLRLGRPIEIGWLAPLAAALGLAVAFVYTRRRLIARVALACGLVLTIGAPFLAESFLIFVDVVPALIALLIATAIHSWSTFRRSYRARGLTNSVSGLPNLNALREESRDHDTALIAARIHNFAEIASALPPEMEKTLVRQIAARLGVGAGGSTIHQGDEGIFVWLARSETDEARGDQLAALHALCRTPVVVAGTHVDLVVTFGVDNGSERSASNRIGSALVAADEAAAEGRRWKAFDPARLKDAAWNLSLLGRLDTAIDNGEIWIAYQPKLDLVSRKIVGAEALVRWAHPEKGEIGPADFIPAAEQHDRIEKLTKHVLGRAVRAAASINARGTDFEVAVNLSARLLDKAGLVEWIEALLIEQRVAPDRLTLEVTESSAMTGNDGSVETLRRLSALGLNISIDDYGTGFSTLEYLRKIPAREIKIDKSFVRMIDRNQSDRLMVASTIHLAHSLGRKVVAEGVETEAILQALEAMGCDKAQGYLIGRPMPLDRLLDVILKPDRRAVA